MRCNTARYSSHVPGDPAASHPHPKSIRTYGVVIGSERADHGGIPRAMGQLVVIDMVKERGEGLRDLEGRYANYFNVGHNAFEVVLVFGQCYEDDIEPQWHTRIVTGPAYAKKLLELLKDALERYEASFGLIHPERPHE